MIVKSKNIKFLAKYKPRTWVAFSEVSNKVIAKAESLGGLSEKIKKISDKIVITSVPSKERFAPTICHQ